MNWFNIGKLSDISDKYQTKFGHKSGKIWLGKRHIKAVMYVKERGKITNREYRKIAKISDEGARVDLKQLVEKGILLLRGKGRNTHYVLK